MNKKMVIIFDVVAGIFNTIMCIVNLMQGNIATGVCLGILAFALFECAMMLKDEDLLYNNNIKVVAMITKNNNKVVLKNCTEDYRNRTDDCCIYDENTLKDMLCFALGDINIDSINFY